MSQGAAVVWFGSYGDGVETNAYVVARWTANEAMAAMQEDYSKDGSDRLQFAEQECPPDAGLAPGLTRWVAEYEFRQGGTGPVQMQYVYVEPFAVPSSREIKLEVREV